MLLVEKVSKRLVRQQKSDVETSLSLPITLLQKYSAKRKIGVSLLESARRLKYLIMLLALH